MQRCNTKLSQAPRLFACQPAYSCIGLTPHSNLSQAPRPPARQPANSCTALPHPLMQVLLRWALACCKRKTSSRRRQAPKACYWHARRLDTRSLVLGHFLPQGVQAACKHQQVLHVRVDVAVHRRCCAVRGNATFCKQRRDC